MEPVKKAPRLRGRAKALKGRLAARILRRGAACRVMREQERQLLLTLRVIRCFTFMSEDAWRCQGCTAWRRALGWTMRCGLPAAMTGDAASDAVNLAALLEDGQQVIVPSKQQVAEGQWGQGAASSAGSAPREGGSAASGGPLNVNQATAEQLVQLNGIGRGVGAAHRGGPRRRTAPSLPWTILLGVSGIGEKKLEGFRDDVCV